MAQKFCRSQRLRKKSDFKRLKNTARKLVARHWVLFLSENGLDKARLAVTISSRYGNAVARNRFRRFLRELFRLNQEHLCGRDLHFIAKQKANTLSVQDYKKEIREDFKRLIDRLN